MQSSKDVYRAHMDSLWCNEYSFMEAMPSQGSCMPQGGNKVDSIM
jgi:hypothetical protein